MSFFVEGGDVENTKREKFLSRCAFPTFSASDSASISC